MARPMSHAVLRLLLVCSARNSLHTSEPAIEYILSPRVEDDASPRCKAIPLGWKGAQAWRACLLVVLGGR